MRGASDEEHLALAVKLGRVLFTQDDDFLHSYTLGKATETVDWDNETEVVEFDGKTYRAYLIAVVYTSG